MVFNGKQIPLSRGIGTEELVFVSGQVPIRDGKMVGGGIQDQTRATLDNIKSILTEAGCTMADVIKCTVWLTDKADFGAFNEVYAEYFPSEPPARSCVVSALVVDAKIEIEAIAVKGKR